MKHLRENSAFIIIGVVVFFFLYMDNRTKEEEKKKNDLIRQSLYSTVAKVKSNGKNALTYIYFYEGIKYSGYISNHGYNYGDCVGNFYRLELSKKHPDLSNIIIDIEVTDSAEIANAGFRIKTLKELLE